MSDTSSDVEEIVQSQVKSKPVYTGAFSILNDPPPSLQVVQAKLLSFNSLPYNVQMALTPQEMSPYYISVRGEANFVIDPIEIHRNCEPFDHTFDISAPIVKDCAENKRAVMICLNESLNNVPAYPLRFVAFVNGKRFAKPDPRYNPKSQNYWLDVSSALTSPKTSLSLQIQHPDPNTKFMIAIRIMNYVSNDNIISQVYSQTPFTIEFWKELMAQKCTCEEDISTTMIDLSLCCPLSLQKILIPVRSVNCKHLLCFDLNAFLDYNRDAGYWVCPVCEKPCDVSDIRTDDVMQGILNRAPWGLNSVRIKYDNEEIQFDIPSGVILDEDSDD